MTSRLQARGFTLVEILVVVLIIGIMAVGAALTVGVAHGDRDLERERDRILALADYMRDQATLQNREFGLRCFRGGYEFVVFDPRTGLWQRDEREDLMRPRRLPKGLTMELNVEGRQIVLPAAEVRPDEIAPQILLYSSGDLSLFELFLERDEQGARFRIAPSPVSDRIEATEVRAGTT